MDFEPEVVLSLDPEYDPEFDGAAAAADELFEPTDEDIARWEESRLCPPWEKEEPPEVAVLELEEKLYGRELTESERRWTEQTGEHPDAMPTDEDPDPSDNHIYDMSEDEEPKEEDLLFLNDGDAKEDVATEDQRDLSEENILDLPTHDEQGRRRSNRKRKAPEFFGLEEEQAYYDKMAEDLAKDCEKFNEDVDGDASSEEEEEEEEEEPEKSDDDISYAPHPEEDAESDSEEDETDDDFTCEAAYVLVGRVPRKDTPCFRALDDEGLILESSEDYINNEEMKDALTTVVGPKTQFVCGGNGDMFARFMTDLEVDTKRPPTWAFRVLKPYDVSEEDWYDEIGKIFFAAYS